MCAFLGHCAGAALKKISEMVSYQGVAVRGIGVRRSVGPPDMRSRNGPSPRDQEETIMTEYLITFNDEWVPDHTAEELREKASAVRAVIEQMLAEDVLIFTNGGLDRSTAVCSVEAGDGQPPLPHRPALGAQEEPRRLPRLGRPHRHGGA